MAVDHLIRASAARRTRGALLLVFGLIATSLAVVPFASADPASGPGAVSETSAGALASGTIPDGTCAARVTAVGGGGASSPVSAGFGGTGGAGASISATFDVLPGQTYSGSVGGGGTLPNGGSGDGAVGTGGDGGTIVSNHRGGGGGGRTSVDLGGTTVVIAGGGGGGGAAHNTAPAGIGGGAGFSGIGAGTVAVGTDGQDGVDEVAVTANGGQGGQAAAGGAGGTNTLLGALDGAAGGGIGTGTGGIGGPDPGFDSAGGGGGGYTGGGGGASTSIDSVSGGGGGGGSSWVRATSPTTGAAAPTAISGSAGAASPAGQGSGATGSISIDWVPCLYSLDIDKSVSAANVDAGGAVVWTVTITNDGPDAMTSGDTVTLTDLLPAGPNGAPAPAYEVLSFDVSGGANSELARGAVTCSGLSVGSAMPASTTCSRAYSAPGAPQTPSGGLRGIDPGETITITYEQIIANTAPCATITNTASVQDRPTTNGSTDLVGDVGTKSDDADLTIGCYDLAITKVASPKPVRAGDLVTWTITITNTGPADMEGPDDITPNPLVITDTFPSTDLSGPGLLSQSGPAGPCGLVGSTITCASGLDNGASQELVYQQTVSPSAVGGATISNTASVTDGLTGDSNDSATDQTTVGVPGITLTKSADPLSYSAAGTVISYDFVVTNIGDLPLAGPLTVADDNSTVTCPNVDTVGDNDADLDPAESITCTSTYTIVQADLDAGSVTNTAQASVDGVTSPQDSATVVAAQGPALLLVKSADPATYDAVDDVISYEFVVTNVGNVTLSGPFTVTDDVSTDESCPVTATLAVGDSITCTASYTITQADLDAGTVVNTASATNGPVTSNDDTATVTAIQGPAISLVKTADRPSFLNAGDEIAYQYVVTNTGNVSLAGPVDVTDDKTTVTCSDVATVGDFDTDLDPGESVTCTSTYTVTPSDEDDGFVTNLAAASVGGVGSTVESATVTSGPAPTPTTPATDARPWVTRPAAGGDVPSIAVWLILATLGILGGTLAYRQRSVRTRRR